LREIDPHSQQKETWLVMNKLSEILPELRVDIFLEFKKQATRTFSRDPTKERKSEQEVEQVQLIDQIGQKYLTEPKNFSHFSMASNQYMM